MIKSQSKSNSKFKPAISRGSRDVQIPQIKPFSYLQVPPLSTDRAHREKQNKYDKPVGLVTSRRQHPGINQYVANSGTNIYRGRSIQLYKCHNTSNRDLSTPNINNVHNRSSHSLTKQKSVKKYVYGTPQSNKYVDSHSPMRICQRIIKSFGAQPHHKPSSTVQYSNNLNYRLKMPTNKNLIVSKNQNIKGHKPHELANPQRNSNLKSGSIIEMFKEPIKEESQMLEHSQINQSNVSNLDENEVNTIHFINNGMDANPIHDGNSNADDHDNTINLINSKPAPLNHIQKQKQFKYCSTQSQTAENNQQKSFYKLAKRIKQDNNISIGSISGLNGYKYTDLLDKDESLLDISDSYKDTGTKKEKEVQYKLQKDHINRMHQEIGQLLRVVNKSKVPLPDNGGSSSKNEKSQSINNERTLSTNNTKQKQISQSLNKRKTPVQISQLNYTQPHTQSLYNPTAQVHPSTNHRVAKPKKPYENHQMNDQSSMLQHINENMTMTLPISISNLQMISPTGLAYAQAQGLSTRGNLTNARDIYHASDRYKELSLNIHGHRNSTNYQDIINYNYKNTTKYKHNDNSIKSIIQKSYQVQRQTIYNQIQAKNRQNHYAYNIDKQGNKNRTINNNVSAHGQANTSFNKNTEKHTYAYTQIQGPTKQTPYQSQSRQSSPKKNFSKQKQFTFMKNYGRGLKETDKQIMNDLSNKIRSQGIINQNVNKNSNYTNIDVTRYQAPKDNTKNERTKENGQANIGGSTQVKQMKNYGLTKRNITGIHLEKKDEKNSGANINTKPESKYNNRDKPIETTYKGTSYSYSYLDNMTNNEIVVSKIINGQRSPVANYKVQQSKIMPIQSAFNISQTQPKDLNLYEPVKSIQLSKCPQNTEKYLYQYEKQRQKNAPVDAYDNVYLNENHHKSIDIHQFNQNEAEQSSSQYIGIIDKQILRIRERISDSQKATKGMQIKYLNKSPNKLQTQTQNKLNLTPRTNQNYKQKQQYKYNVENDQNCYIQPSKKSFTNKHVNGITEKNNILEESKKVNRNQANTLDTAAIQNNKNLAKIKANKKSKTNHKNNQNEFYRKIAQFFDQQIAKDIELKSLREQLSNAKFSNGGNQLTKTNNLIRKNTPLSAATSSKMQQKWVCLSKKLQRQGYYYSPAQIKQLMQLSNGETDPFNSISTNIPQSSLQQLCSRICSLFISAQSFWNTHINGCMLGNKQFEFGGLSIDLNKKGYICIEDIVCFVNLFTGKFYKNRDVMLVFKRLCRKAGHDVRKNMIQYKVFEDVIHGRNKI